MIETVGTVLVALIGAASGVFAVLRSRPIEEAKVEGEQAERKLSETELIIHSWRDFAHEKDAEVDRLKADIIGLRERLSRYEKGSTDA